MLAWVKVSAFSLLKKKKEKKKKKKKREKILGKEGNSLSQIDVFSYEQCVREADIKEQQWS